MALPRCEAAPRRLPPLSIPPPRLFGRVNASRCCRHTELSPYLRRDGAAQCAEFIIGGAEGRARGAISAPAPAGTRPRPPPRSAAAPPARPPVAIRPETAQDG